MRRGEKVAFDSMEVKLVDWVDRDQLRRDGEGGGRKGSGKAGGMIEGKPGDIVVVELKRRIGL